MKQEPCAYCGAKYHQPYEDGLVECRNNLKARVEELRSVLEDIEGGNGCYTASYADCCDMNCAHVARKALKSGI